MFCIHCGLVESRCRETARQAVALHAGLRPGALTDFAGLSPEALIFSSRHRSAAVRHGLRLRVESQPLIFHADSLAERVVIPVVQLSKSVSVCHAHPDRERRIGSEYNPPLHALLLPGWPPGQFHPGGRFRESQEKSFEPLAHLPILADPYRTLPVLALPNRNHPVLARPR